MNARHLIRMRRTRRILTRIFGCCLLALLLIAAFAPSGQMQPLTVVIDTSGGQHD